MLGLKLNHVSKRRPRWLMFTIQHKLFHSSDGKVLLLINTMTCPRAGRKPLIKQILMKIAEPLLWHEWITSSYYILESRLNKMLKTDSQNETYIWNIACLIGYTIHLIYWIYENVLKPCLPKNIEQLRKLPVCGVPWLVRYRCITFYNQLWRATWLNIWVKEWMHTKSSPNQLTI